MLENDTKLPRTRLTGSKYDAKTQHNNPAYKQNPIMDSQLICAGAWHM